MRCVKIISEKESDSSDFQIKSIDKQHTIHLNNVNQINKKDK